MHMLVCTFVCIEIEALSLKHIFRCCRPQALFKVGRALLAKLGALLSKADLQTEKDWLARALQNQSHGHALRTFWFGLRSAEAIFDRDCG